MTTETYNVLSLILQLFVWCAMIATFVVYYFQLKTMQRAATGQNMLSLINHLQASEVRAARTTVHKTLKDKDYSEWTDDEKRQASLVCSTYDVAAILIFQQKLVPEEPFISNWGPSIKNCYRICTPLIKEMQSSTNAGPHYWNDFEKLYSAASQ